MNTHGIPPIPEDFSLSVSLFYDISTFVGYLIAKSPL